jgi:hypothetical protein
VLGALEVDEGISEIALVSEIDWQIEEVVGTLVVAIDQL